MAPITIRASYGVSPAFIIRCRRCSTSPDTVCTIEVKAATGRQLAETVAQGRATVEKEQRREGALQANLEQLAHKLGFAKPDELFAAVARDEVNLRQLQATLRE
mgnify:CR=1 FL=1